MNNSANLTKIAFTFWGCMFLYAIIKTLYAPEFRSVFVHYYRAGVLWSAQEPLYNGGRGFIYLPTFAFIASLFSFFNIKFASLFWQVLQISSLISSVYYFSRSFSLPNRSSNFFIFITLFSIPLCFSSFRNAQANILMLSIALWVCICIVQEKWNMSVFLLVLGLCIKPTFIVFFLLMGATYPHLRKQLLLGVITAMIIPIIFSPTSYVVSQYKDAFKMLDESMNIGIYETCWANIFNAWTNLVEQEIPKLTQTILRMITAITILVISLHIKKKSNHIQFILVIFILSFCYLLVFNPRSENNDYMYSGIIYGYLFAYNLSNKMYRMASCFALLLLMTIFSPYLGILLKDCRTCITPIINLFFTIGFGYYLLKIKQPFSRLTEKSTN